jgi:hypothetical protein
MQGSADRAGIASPHGWLHTAAGDITGGLAGVTVWQSVILPVTRFGYDRFPNVLFAWNRKGIGSSGEPIVIAGLDPAN